MRISKIHIKNWRSIKEVIFYPTDICILVGQNNAGKTNILSAINFILGERWPMPSNLDDSDYYMRDRNRVIKIKISIDNHHEVAEIEFDSSKPQFALTAYNRAKQTIRGFNNAQREELAFVYIDASRSYEKSFSPSRWSLFGQALRNLHNALKQDDDQLSLLREVLSQAHILLKTDQYDFFENELKSAFLSQLKTANYDVYFEFRTLEETNLYKGLFPTIIEHGFSRNPTEIGSGIRNVLVLSLFQAFAKTFKGCSILGIEEPELYLHPHAQRSLMKQFETLSASGSQLFLSTHNSHFIDLTRTDRIVLVDRVADDEDEISTQVRTSSAIDLLNARKSLHSHLDGATIDSIRAFIKNISSIEMTEAYFSRFVIIVEGPSERESIPIYGKFLGLDFDEYGITIVSAGGKSTIDTLAQLYSLHRIPTYIIFDNDHGKPSERAANKTLCRVLSISETENPAACITDTYAILDSNWEKQCRGQINEIQNGLYDELEAEAKLALSISGDRNKPLIARFIANRLIQKNIVPLFAAEIIQFIKGRLCIE